MPLTAAPAAEGIIPSSFLLYWGQGNGTTGRGSGLRPVVVGRETVRRLMQSNCTIFLGYRNQSHSALENLARVVEFW